MDKTKRHILFAAAIAVAEILISLFTKSNICGSFIFANMLPWIIYMNMKKDHFLDVLAKDYPQLLKNFPKLKDCSVCWFFFELEGEQIDEDFRSELREPLVILCIYGITFFTVGIIACTR